jgi:hypothetical protein
MKARPETRCARGRRMHASKDSRAALRCAGWICRGALSLSFHLSISFLSSTGVQVVTSLPSPRLLPSPLLSCPALHCTALCCTISNPLPSPPLSLLISLTPHHTTPCHGKRSTVLLCMQYHPSRGTSPVAAACTCTCTHTHTDADV